MKKFSFIEFIIGVIAVSVLVLAVSDTLRSKKEGHYQYVQDTGTGICFAYVEHRPISVVDCGKVKHVLTKIEE